MGGFFGIDSKFSVVMGKIADLMVLNVIWLICCIPVVTIGASTTAMHYVAMKMVKNEESYIIKSFFRSFKENFKQATIMWLIVMALGAILGVDFYALRGMQGTAKNILFPCVLMVVALYLFTFAYLFPQLAKFANTTKNIFKNSVLMSIRHFPYTILLVLLNALPFAALIFLLQSLPLWMLIGFSGIAYFEGWIFNRIFENYIPKENEETNKTEEK